MASREIVLWLDERWYDALERHCRSETLQDKLENYLDELINHLPTREYERISKELYLEWAERQAQREAARRFAVFRVREEGVYHCVLVDEPVDLLMAARALRSYGASESKTGFSHYYASAREITGWEFLQSAREHTANPGRVTGAYDVDLDRETVSELDVVNGWRTYRLKDVCTAVYFADRRREELPDHRMRRLAEYLRGKELPQRESVHSPQRLFGTRDLRAEDISFADEIWEDCGTLNFYLEVFDGLDDALGTHVCTDQNDDYVNIYADYDLLQGEAADVLLVVLHRGNGIEEIFDYPLSTEEKQFLLPKMEQYCQKQSGITLAEYRERFLTRQREDAVMTMEQTL